MVLFIMCVEPTILLPIHFHVSPNEIPLWSEIPLLLVVDDDARVYAYSILRDDESLLEYFLHHPYLGEDLVFPLDFNIIYLHQQQDAQLQQLNQTQPLRYPFINFDNL